jgi:hypothetical protein
LGPRNVYKDMLNNMVSLIDHVVMNHQNQTRTNGKWGHVRYSVDTKRPRLPGAEREDKKEKIMEINK